MKNEYSFYIGDDNDLSCSYKKSEIKNNFDGELALQKLKELDELIFQNVEINKRSIKLYNDYTELYIFDLDKFFELGYLDSLKNYSEKIKQAIENSSDNKNKKVKKSKIDKVSISVGSSILFIILLTATIKVFDSKTNDSNNENSIESTFDQDETNNYTEPETETQIEEVSSSTGEYEFSNTVFDSTDFVSKDFIDTKLENNKVELPEEKITVAEDEPSVAYFDFEENRYSYTGNYTYERYHDLIKKCSDRLGVSDNLVMAILTQESAGKVFENLMQIEDEWIKRPLDCYDFENNKMYKLVLINGEDSYEDGDTIYISKNRLNEPEINITFAILILRQSIKEMHYNIPAGIQGYNYGYPKMEIILKAAASDQGITMDELLEDNTNISFMNYTYLITESDDPEIRGGDPDYLKNIIQYVENAEDGVWIKIVDEEGNINKIEVSFVPKGKKM